jgi:hypothetical protein
MKHVLKDLLRRKLLFIFLAIYLITILASTGVHAGSLGLLLVLGAFLIPPQPESTTINILRTLPVSSRALGTAYWLFAVVLFPAFYFFWSLFGKALFLGSGGVPIQGEVLQVLPRAAVALIGMGYASILFLLIPPNAMASSRGIFWEWVLAVLWLCSALPVLYLQEAVFAGYREQTAWFYLALLASPIAMGAAYRFAPSSMRNVRQRTTAQPLQSKANQPQNAHSNLVLWVQKFAVSLGLATSFLAIILLSQRWVSSSETPGTTPVFGMGLVAIAGVYLRLPLRALRMLPLSSLRLTLLLAAVNSIALFAAAIAIIVALVATDQLDLVWPSIPYLLCGFAFRLLSIALPQRFGIGGVLLVILVFLVGLMPIVVMVFSERPGYLSYAHAWVCVLAAIVLTKVFLERSSEVYQTPEVNATPP